MLSSAGVKSPSGPTSHTALRGDRPKAAVVAASTDLSDLAPGWRLAISFKS